MFRTVPSIIPLNELPVIEECQVSWACLVSSETFLKYFSKRIKFIRNKRLFFHRSGHDIGRLYRGKFSSDVELGLITKWYCSKDGQVSPRMHFGSDPIKIDQ